MPAYELEWAARSESVASAVRHVDVVTLHAPLNGSDFETALGVIRTRLGRLSPPPLQRRLPLLIRSKGARVGLRLVAEYADIRHA